MRILLTTDTRKMPLSFSGSTNDPLLGTVVISEKFKNDETENSSDENKQTAKTLEVETV